jgi:hypothetical protein
MIFGKSDFRVLSSSESSTEKRKEYEKFKDAVMSRLVQLKYFRVSPKYVYIRAILLIYRELSQNLQSVGTACWAVVPPLVLLTVTSSPDLITSWPLLAVSISVVGWMLIFSAKNFSTRTPEGKQVAEDWLQFQKYIQVLLSREPTDDYVTSYERVFEEYLPYTILFGRKFCGIF